MQSTQNLSASHITNLKANVHVGAFEFHRISKIMNIETVHRSMIAKGTCFPLNTVKLPHRQDQWRVNFDRKHLGKITVI